MMTLSDVGARRDAGVKGTKISRKNFMNIMNECSVNSHQKSGKKGEWEEDRRPRRVEGYLWALIPKWNSRNALVTLSGELNFPTVSRFLSTSLSLRTV